MIAPSAAEALAGRGQALQPLLLVQPLHALDGVALVVQQHAHAAQDLDVLRPVEAPAAGPLHGPDEGELGLPEAQDVLRHADLVGRFRDGSECVRTFGDRAKFAHDTRAFPTRAFMT
jgi:hypothetical protein